MWLMNIYIVFVVHNFKVRVIFLANETKYFKNFHILIYISCFFSYQTTLLQSSDC